MNLNNQSSKLFVLFRHMSGLVVVLLGFILLSCQQKLEQTDLIRFNQVGFYPSQDKKAVLVVPDITEYGEFQIRNLETGKIDLVGELSGPRISGFSDKKTYLLFFSEITTPGEYLIEIPGIGKSTPFLIKEHVLHDVASAALKGFYYQRMSTPIEEKYAGKWARPQAYPDTKVKIHASAASRDRPEGTIISSPKGWYDAGDYNKYMVNSGFTVGVLLSLYEDYPDYVKQLSVNIPESDNKTPDLLNEVYWNIAWMLTMQDPTDGGVYHKLTTSDFEGFITPEVCEKDRYVVAKSVTASLDFAASMAQASRLYARRYYADYPGVSKTLLQAAKDAFAWALKNPNALYDQQQINEKYLPHITTGEYGDKCVVDEFFWAAAELYVATGDKIYLDILREYQPDKFVLPVWNRVSGLGCLTLIRHANKVIDEELPKEMKRLLLAYADSSLVGYEQSSYAASYGRVSGDFFWGCNSDGASNQGIAFLYAFKLTGEDKYLKAALDNMDYILGRNATGYCYVTGFGNKSPMHPHHRLSASDNIEEPIPGLLVGGPNPYKQDDCGYPSNIPDECYVDIQSSYASNEIAINWQGLFTYFAMALDASIL